MVDAAVRFDQKVQEAPSGCFIWTGTLYPNGYGRFYDYKNHGVRAHRWAYERAIGPILDGMTIDHLCHDPYECKKGVECEHRKCVNPKHLTVATIQENLKRRSSVVVTHCPSKHEYTGDNLYITPAGTRSCKACSLARYHKKKGA